MKKVLFFSRHALTKVQIETLTQKMGSVELHQCSGSPQNIHVPFTAEAVETPTQGAQIVAVGTAMPALKEYFKQFDEVVVVLPVGMLEQLTNLKIQPLRAVMSRTVDSDGKASFVFEKFERVLKISTVVEDF